MSRAIVTNINDADNNNYIIRIPRLGEVSAQCVTVDEIILGMEVRIIDVDNQSPSINKQFGNFRFLPNSHPDQSITPEYSYINGGMWKSPSELWESNNKASLAIAYMLSSKRNEKWQKTYPLYKKGTVTEIIDEKYMRVNIYGDMNRKCRTDYMTCDTAAFEIDDIVVVFYENGSFDKPVVVGFWDGAIPCTYTPISCDGVPNPTANGPCSGEWVDVTDPAYWDVPSTTMIWDASNSRWIFPGPGGDTVEAQRCFVPGNWWDDKKLYCIRIWVSGDNPATRLYAMGDSNLQPPTCLDVTSCSSNVNYYRIFFTTSIVNGAIIKRSFTTSRCTVFDSFPYFVNMNLRKNANTDTSYIDKIEINVCIVE
jgi:hypothetical protein